MRKRLIDVVDQIDYNDLVKMKMDIEDGGVHLKKLVEGKIKEHQKNHDVVCSACSAEIDKYSTNNFTLLFGPEDFKKKATFCGVDCLQYFLGQLKKIKEVQTVRSESVGLESNDSNAQVKE